MSKYKAVDALKQYFDKASDKNYSDVMSKAQKDNSFEKMIQDITFGKATGHNKFDKLKRTF